MTTINLTKTARATNYKGGVKRIQAGEQHLVEYMPTRKAYSGRTVYKKSCGISRWTLLVRDLKVGQGFVVPTESERLTQMIRNIACREGKALGRKFPTRRITGKYVYVTREM